MVISKPDIRFRGVNPNFHHHHKDVGGSLNIQNHNQQAAQMDAFALNILNNTPVIASGDQGLRDMIYIEGIYEAARSGQKVRF